MSCICGVRELLHQVLGVGVTLELQLDAAPPTIVADPNRIEQAVLNLVVNARDAMPAGGRVTIATHTEPAPSHALVLSVADTGAGMDIATRSRIFEPFFTTKPPGFGTGLGLSTTDDIVRAAGGVIEVDSERGQRHHVHAHVPGGRRTTRRPSISSISPMSWTTHRPCWSSTTNPTCAR